jgi:hypothetical protein
VKTRVGCRLEFQRLLHRGLFLWRLGRDLYVLLQNPFHFRLIAAGGALHQFVKHLVELGLPFVVGLHAAGRIAQ